MRILAASLILTGCGPTIQSDPVVTMERTLRITYDSGSIEEVHVNGDHWHVYSCKYWDSVEGIYQCWDSTAEFTVVDGRLCRDYPYDCDFDPVQDRVEYTITWTEISAGF